MKSAVEGSGENKGLSEKMDSDEKEKIQDALKDGQEWLDSNPEADAEEIKDKHKEIEGICAPIIPSTTARVVVAVVMKVVMMRTRLTMSSDRSIIVIACMMAPCQPTYARSTVDILG